MSFFLLAAQQDGIVIDAPITLGFRLGTPVVTVLTRNAFQQAIYVDDFLGSFTNTDEFAVSASYYHSTLKRYETYPVNFDDPHVTASLSDQNSVTYFRPQFLICEALLRHRIVKGDACMISGRKYFVDDYHKDGVGGVTVYLEQQ